VLKPKALFLGLMAVLVAGFALGGQAIPNWPAPATWTPTRASGVHTLGDITYPAIFVGVTPCRVADTRGNGFTGAYGPPSLVANATRSFTITGVCGIPSGAAAVSFNFAAANIPGLGDLRVGPAPPPLPLVSTINYNGAAPVVANAAVVPLGSGGAITVQADAVPIDLFFDVNGYYLDQGGTITTGEFMGFIGNIAAGLVFGVNSSTSTGGATSAFRGELTGAGNGGAAVLGQQFSSTGVNYGVRGDSISAANEAAAVYGTVTATSGRPRGVFGKTAGVGLDTSGVYGKDGSAVLGPGCTGFGGCSFSSGVRGEGRNGVMGLTSDNVNDVGAVVGLFLNSAGTLGAFGELGYSFTTAVHGDGNLVITGTKSFVTPHPTDAAKMIDYVSLEGPEAGTYFRGTAQIVSGMAVISVPDHFAMVTDEEGLTVQLTPVGSAANMYIVSEDLNQIVVRANRDVKFHYQVNGIRSAFKDHQPIAENTSFVPRSANTPMTAGLAEAQIQALISNGTLNADRTVNLQTAARLGWVKIWEDKAKAAEKASVKPVSPGNGSMP